MKLSLYNALDRHSDVEEFILVRLRELGFRVENGEMCFYFGNRMIESYLMYF